MNKCYVDVQFPNGADKSMAILSFNAITVGDALFLSQSGPKTKISFSYDTAKRMFDQLVNYADKKRRRQEYPYPQTITLTTNNGPTTLDAHLVSELVGALAIVVAENEIGDLLEQYKPD